MSVSSYNDFSAGMVKDPLPGQIPGNAVSDALDVFFDVPGKVRRRFPTTTLSATARTATGIAVGSIMGGNVQGPYALRTDGTLGVYDGSNVFQAISSTFGTPLVAGRPVQFFHVLLFPTYNGSSQSYVPAIAGADESGFGSYSPPAGTIATVTAGSNVVNFTNGDFAANTQINGNQFVVITNSATSPTREYYLGTFQASAAHTIIVDPVPTRSFTATQAAGVGTFVASVYAAFDTALANPNTAVQYSGKCAAVHQNRVLLGNVSRFNTTTTKSENFPRSVFYSILPKETPSGNTSAQGHTWMMREGIEPNNSFDIGGSAPIMALAPIDDNELLIFTSIGAWRLTGYLSTRIANDAGGVTYDVHPVVGSPGLLHERSLQQTPHGLVMAAPDDIYLYAAGRFQPLLGKANAKYWQDLLSIRVVLGAHLLNPDLYVISIGTDGAGGGGGGSTMTFALHIPTRSLSRLSGNSLVLFDAVRDPFNPGNRIGLRWWDTTLTAPSMTGSQVVYTSDVASTSTSGATDADAHVITPIITTRIYDENSPNEKKRFWRSVWRLQGGATIQIDRFENAYAPSLKTVGSPVSGVLNASYTGPVLHTPGVQYTITAPTVGDPFEFYGFDHFWDPIAYAKAS